MAVLSSPSRTTILAPPSPHLGAAGRLGDYLVPWDLAGAEGVEVRVAPFEFEGGDLIADGSRVFVAAPLLGRNPSFERDPQRLVRLLERELGREIIDIGFDGTPVPDHHIGMFVTPLGDGRVVVGDPDLGLAVLPGGLVMVGSRPVEADRREETLERFRNVRRVLELRGIEVIPIPIVPTREPYVFVSYNNSLLEERRDGVHVYMPTYGVGALDAAATAAFERAGARVHPLPAGRVFGMGGTVRCLAVPL
jgi:hypothetical protein